MLIMMMFGAFLPVNEPGVVSDVALLYWRRISLNSSSRTLKLGEHIQSTLSYPKYGIRTFGELMHHL